MKILAARFLASLTILVGCHVSHAQLKIYDIWRATVTGGAYQTVVREDGAFLTGFLFQVTTRGDGAQPFLQNKLYVRSGQPYVNLYRKVGTTYWPFCNWNQSFSPPVLGQGILLPPGTYLVQDSEFQALPYPPPPPATIQLYGGQWATPAQQSRYWRLAGNDYAGVTANQGGSDSTIYGFRFSVKPRADGSLVYVTHFTNALVSSRYTIYRFDGSVYRIHIAADAAYPNTGFLLDPGDYLFATGSTPLSPGLYKYYVILTGYWARPGGP